LRYRQDTETVREREREIESDSPYFARTIIHYALLGCAYTSELMLDECQSHISC